MRKLLATLLLALPTLAMAQQAAVVSQTDAAAPASDGSASCPANYAAIIVIRDGARINQHLCCKDKGGGSWKWERCDAGLGGTGTVTGPASSTDNAIVRWDGTTGTKIDQATSNTPTISDVGVVSVPGGLALPTTSTITDGRIFWDGTTDDLKVGTGSGSQTLIAAPSSGEQYSIPYYLDSTGTSLGYDGFGLQMFAGTRSATRQNGDLVQDGSDQSALIQGSSSTSFTSVIGFGQPLAAIGSMNPYMARNIRATNAGGPWNYSDQNNDNAWSLVGACPSTIGDGTGTLPTGDGNGDVQGGICFAGVDDAAFATDVALTHAQFRNYMKLAMLPEHRSILFDDDWSGDGTQGMLQGPVLTGDRLWSLQDASGTIAHVSQTAAGNSTPLTWNVTTTNCTNGANGGALTVNLSNQIVCEDDDGGGDTESGPANEFDVLALGPWGWYAADDPNANGGTHSYSDGDPVAPWHDKSGNDRDGVDPETAWPAQGFDPALWKNTGTLPNSKPYLQFASTRFYDIPETTFTAFTVIVVSAHANTVTHIGGDAPAQNPGEADAYLRAAYGNGATKQSYWTFDENGVTDPQSEHRPFSLDSDLTTSDWRAHVYKRSGTSTAYQINGETAYITFSQGDQSKSATWRFLAARRPNNAGPQGNTQNLAEIIIFNRALSDAELALVYEYVGAKYGIAQTQNTPGGSQWYVQYKAGETTFGGVPYMIYNPTESTPTDQMKVNLSSNSTLTLPQGETPGNTTEGVIQWDTNDNKMSIGDGAAALKFLSVDEGGSTNAYLCTYSSAGGAGTDKLICATDPSSLGGGSGDVSAVGNCTGGECFDGTVDGGTSLTFYDSVTPKVFSYTEAGEVFTLPGNLTITGGGRTLQGGGSSGEFRIRSVTDDSLLTVDGGIVFEYLPNVPAGDEVSCPFIWYSERDTDVNVVSQFCNTGGWKIVDFATGSFDLESPMTEARTPKATACTSGQFLTWDDNVTIPGTNSFECASGPLIDIEEQETTRVTDAATIDFAGVDFDVVADGKEANISIGASITRDAEWDTSAEIRTNLDEGDSSYTGTGDLVFADAPTFANSTVQFGTNPGPNPVQTHYTAMQVPQYGRMAWEIPFVSNVTGPTEFSFATAWATFNGIRDNNFGKYYNVYPGMGKINNNTYGVGDYWEMDGAVDCAVPPGPACPKFEWNMDFVPEPEHVSNEAWRYWYFVLDPALRSGDGAVQTFAFSTNRNSDDAWLIQDDTTTGATGAKVDFNYSPTHVTGAGKTRAHYGNFAGTQQNSAYAFSASRVDRGTGTTSHAEEYGGVQSIIELGSATSTHDYGYARGNRTEINAIGTATSQTSEEVVGFSTKVTVNPSGLCSGGSNNGNYCDDSSDCPGGTCPASSHNYDDVYGLNVEWGTIRDEASIITRSAGVRVGDWATTTTNKQADFRYGLWVGDQKCPSAATGDVCGAIQIAAQTNGDGSAGNLNFGGGDYASGHLTFRDGYVHLYNSADATHSFNTSALRLTRDVAPGSLSSRSGGLVATSNGGTLASSTSPFAIEDGDHWVQPTGSTNLDSINTCDTANKGKNLTVLCGSYTGTLNDGTGNLQLVSNLTCTANNTLSLICDGTNWVETSRSAVAGDSVSVNGSPVVDPNFSSTASQITFTDTSNTITANITDGAVVPADLDTTGSTWNFNDEGTANGSTLEIPNANAATVSAGGQIAVDTSGTQGEQLLFHDGAETNVLDPLRSVCAMIPDLTEADDNFEFWFAPFAVTITQVGCHCRGSCGTLASFTLEDRTGNAMTGTPTCSTLTDDTAFTNVTSGSNHNKLNVGEGLRFDVTNTPTANDEYTLCVRYKVDAR